MSSAGRAPLGRAGATGAAELSGYAEQETGALSDIREGIGCEAANGAVPKPAREVNAALRRDQRAASR